MQELSQPPFPSSPSFGPSSAMLYFCLTKCIVSEFCKDLSLIFLLDLRSEQPKLWSHNGVRKILGSRWERDTILAPRFRECHSAVTI